MSIQTPLPIQGSSYGYDTLSWRRSPEKRQMDAHRAEVTAAHLATAHSAIEVSLTCRCPQRFYPHELSVHSNLMRESYNPQLRSRWPWSLARTMEAI